MENITQYLPQFTQIFSRSPQLSDIKPSEWAEKNIVIPGGKGRLNYDFNPYCREIIDTMAPDHPAKKIAVMKGSQITFSSGVIMPTLGYIIKEDPHNTYLMVGTPDLVKMAVEKLDYMIHGAKLQDYISYQIQKKRNTKSGDTDEIKSFINGYIKTGSATNPKSIAQVDLERIFLDDFDAMKGQSKVAGSFLDLIEMRAAANMNTYKLMMISTPLIKSESNIEPAFLAGDQRKYFLECPCCHKPIIIKREVPEGSLINSLTNQVAAGTGGLIYERNNHGQLIKSSVGYVCYLCAGFFKDNNKQQMLREGIWCPTAIPISDDYFSYTISSLYAPVGMFDWAYYAGKVIEANPGNGEPRNEYKMQVIINTCDGETYEPQQESTKASDIMSNMQSYKVGMIPDALSISQGNGRIILVTCTSDLNGIEDDARLDWLITAWSESGAVYCIKHGSIGTFIPRENTLKVKENRQPWTYRLGMPNNVWDEFDKITRQPYLDESGNKYFIDTPGIDMGHEPKHVEDYINWTIGRYPDNQAIGVRGKGEGKYTAKGSNLRLFSQGLARKDTYFLEVGLFKDRLAVLMKLKWNEGENTQPPGFINFPHAEDGLFEYPSFFEHFEQEHRVPVKNKNGGEMFRWVKKKSNSQNHMFDCFVYNMALREIIVQQVGDALRKAGRFSDKEFTWADYANYMTGR